MRKRRRIEITAFRRQTTITLRDMPDVGLSGPPVGDGVSPHTDCAYKPRAEDIGLKRTHNTNPDVDDHVGLVGHGTRIIRNQLRG